MVVPIITPLDVTAVAENSEQCERNLKFQDGRIQPLLVPSDNIGTVNFILIKSVNFLIKISNFTIFNSYRF